MPPSACIGTYGEPRTLTVERYPMRIANSDPVLAVYELDRTADWFTRVLGCERTDPDPDNWVFRRAGEVTFMLGHCPRAWPASQLGDHSYVAYLTVDVVDEFYQRALLLSAGVKRSNRRAVEAPGDGATVARWSSLHAWTLALR